MKTRIKAIICLARYKEYIFFVVITTFLGASAANGTFGWPLLLVLAANWLAVAFAFMINDVEDAPDDALNPEKVNRNPVSARILSPRAAYTASYFVAALALLAYAPLGINTFLTGASSVVISFLYSWRKIRLKTIPVLDMISHCLMLAGLQYLCGYYAFEPAPLFRWLFPFLFLIAFSVYGVLFNQLRDLKYDLEAGLTHTACLLGERYTYRIMMTAAFLGLVSAAVSIFVVHLLDYWVLVLIVILAGFMLISPLLKIWRSQSAMEMQQSVQKPLEIAVAFALTVQFLGPWIWKLLTNQGVINYLATRLF